MVGRGGGKDEGIGEEGIKEREEEVIEYLLLM